MRKKFFITSRIYIHKLAEIEKKNAIIRKRILKSVVVMEQKKRHDAILSFESWPIVSKSDFFKAIYVRRFDRYRMLVFTLNTFHCVDSSNEYYCSCHEKKFFSKKKYFVSTNFVKGRGVPYWDSRFVKFVF